MRDTASKTPRANFSIERVLAVIWRVLKQISRDRRTLGMMIMMPAVIMLIFGFALGGEVKNIPILIDNQDSGFSTAFDSISVNLYAGEQIVSFLQADSRVRVEVGSYRLGVSGVDDGTYSASILIPTNFSQSVFLGSEGQIVSYSFLLYIDGTKPPIETSIIVALQNALQGVAGSRSVNLDKQYAFGGTKFSGLDVSVPSVMAFVLAFLVLLISLVIVSRETTSGTLPRLFTTPLSAIERLLGYSIALLLLSLIMVGVILGIGIGVFGVIVRGSLLLLFSGAVLYALAHVFLAVFLANFAKNELQAVQMAPLIALPSMALSGMLVPVNSFPDWIQILAKLVPMYYGNRIFEGIMLRGYGLSELWLEFIIIGVVALIFLVLAVTTVRDRMTD